MATCFAYKTPHDPVGNFYVLAALPGGLKYCFGLSLCFGLVWVWFGSVWFLVSEHGLARSARAVCWARQRTPSPGLSHLCGQARRPPGHRGCLPSSARPHGDQAFSPEMPSPHPLASVRCTHFPRLPAVLPSPGSGPSSIPATPGRLGLCKQQRRGLRPAVSSTGGPLSVGPFT